METSARHILQRATRTRTCSRGAKRCLSTASIQRRRSRLELGKGIGTQPAVATAAATVVSSSFMSTGRKGQWTADSASSRTSSPLHLSKGSVTMFSSVNAVQEDASYVCPHCLTKSDVAGHSHGDEGTREASHLVNGNGAKMTRANEKPFQPSQSTHEHEHEHEHEHDTHYHHHDNESTTHISKAPLDRLEYNTNTHPEPIPVHVPNMQHICDNICQDNYKMNNLTLPPPLPEPKYSFHRRVMPESLIQFSSPEGKLMFQESLSRGMSEAFFPLSEQFLNQSDPAYCGVTTLVMILNAIGIDPNVRWKGGWRWYADEMILETCCINAERVQRAGILMEEFQSLARCQTLSVEMKRPLMLEGGVGMSNGNLVQGRQEKEEDEKYHGLDEFRQNIIEMVQNPPIYSQESNQPKGGFMTVSFSRSALGQTGEGHFSPIAAYHEASDRCLVMDVARFKYAPYWVRVEDLYESTRPIDPMTGKSRGWFLMYPSLEKEDFRGTKAHDEAKRSAESVPLYSSQEKNHVCRIDEPQDER